MPYKIRKQKCKQSTGKKGSYVLSYKDNKGKKHRACHTSRKKARGQIAAIEAEGVERNEVMRITLPELKQMIQDEVLNETKASVNELPGVAEKTLVCLGNIGNPQKLERSLNDLKSTLRNLSTYIVPDPIILSKINQVLELDAADIKSVKQVLDSLANTDPATERAALEQSIEMSLKGAIPVPAAQSTFNESTLTNLRSLIREFIFEAKKNKKRKKKYDVDGDGDQDSADYKMKQYIAGGISKDDALKKSRKFNK